MRILVVGGSGRLGMRLVRRLLEEGRRVRVLARDPQRFAPLAAQLGDVVAGDLTAGIPDSLCADIDLVISCASASTRLLEPYDDTSFESVNHYGNVGLLRAALRAGVQKFVYLAPLGAERLAHTAYGGAHQRFVETLARSPMPHTVIRATAGFEAIDEALTLLRAGHPWLFGESERRTNPIHVADLADFAVRSLTATDTELSVGGPRSYCRCEIARLARAALADGPSRYGAPLEERPVLRRSNRRIRDLLEFGSAIAALDVLGPPHGSRDLELHLRCFASTGRPLQPAFSNRGWLPGPLLALDVQPLQG